MVHTDGFGVLEDFFCPGSAHRESGDFTTVRFPVLKGRFNGKLVVRTHDHLNGRKIDPVAVDDDLGVGIWDLFDEDDDVGHVNQLEW